MTRPSPTPIPTSRLVVSRSIDDLLLLRISRLLATAGGMVTRLCEGRFGITRREWRVLAELVQQPGVSPSQLAEQMQLDRARTSRAITSMVHKGLVARAPRPGNRREVVLSVTDKGREVHDAMVPLAVDINRRLVAALTPEDAQRLDASLDALQACADGLVARAELPKADRRRGANAAPP